MFEDGVRERGKAPESPEVLMARLTQMPETSGKLRAMFTPKFVEEFMRIMTSPQAVEIDCFLLSGEMTPQEAYQYNIASGNHDVCGQQLTDLALRIANHFRPNLARMVRNDMRGGSGGKTHKEGIFQFFQEMEQLQWSRFERITDLRVTSYRLATNFEHALMAVIGADLIELLFEKGTEKAVETQVKSFITRIDDIFLRKKGMNFPGIQFYKERQGGRQVFEGRKNARCLASVTHIPDSIDDHWRADIRKGIEADFQYIRQEVPYKRVPLVTVHASNPQIIVMRDDPSRYKRRGICEGRVNFRDELLPGFPEFERDNQGGTFSSYAVLPNVVNFEVNPVNGDLCFITSGVPLTQIMSADQYLALQHFILSGLRDYLAGKDPDIEDLFMLRPKEREQEAPAPEGIVSEEVTMPASGNRPESVWARDSEGGAIVTDETFAKQEVPDNVLPKNFRRVVVDCINGARARDILGALRRMLGDEVRIKSSHHSFRSPRTRVTMPVPKHSQGSPHHISLPIILNDLRAWGYTPLELAVELGLDVPDRFLPGKSDEKK